MKNGAVGRTGGGANDPYFVRLEKPLIDSFLQLGHCLFGVFLRGRFLIQRCQNIRNEILDVSKLPVPRKCKKYPS